MGIPVISSRKPEFDHKQCSHCRTQLEFPIPKSKQTSVQCYSCQKISTFDTFREANKTNGTTSCDYNNNNKSGSSKKPRRQFGTEQEPLETELYDILGVSPTASSSEIKKQYYKLALQFHPDKNKSPDAEYQFKKISDAYQILSNPDLRKKYNEFGGKNDVEPEGGFVNPEDFFRQQFGGDRFVDIIGEISIGRDMKEVLQNAAEDTNGDGAEMRRETNEEERDKIRQQRVDKLVSNLIHKLSMYVDSNDAKGAEQFKNVIEIEADDLKAESYGIELLHAIGFTYSLKAKQYIGGDQIFGLPRFGHILREKGHVFSETISTLRSAIDLQNSFKELQKAEQEGLNDVEKSKLEEATANKGLTALWKGSKLEVEGVLREVCDRVLSDSKESKEVLIKRAEGLKIIGAVYENVKSDSE